MLFRCTAWDQHRVNAARYALRLMTGLMPDIRGMHRTNIEYTGTRVMCREKHLERCFISPRVLRLLTLAMLSLLSAFIGLCLLLCRS